jgi:hypothetical protein
MRIGIIGPSKVEGKESISKIAKIIAASGNEVVVCPDKGSSSEYFAQQYLASGGKKVWEIIPLDDKEFGFDWINTDLGEHINCGIWRNQPEKLNEETDALLCLGYSIGVLAEIAYTKWFKPKTVYIIKELISGELPREINERLDLRYVSIFELEKKLKAKEI